MQHIYQYKILKYPCKRLVRVVCSCIRLLAISFPDLFRNIKFFVTYKSNKKKKIIKNLIKEAELLQEKHYIAFIILLLKHISTFVSWILSLYDDLNCHHLESYFSPFSVSTLICIICLLWKISSLFPTVMCVVVVKRKKKVR